MSNERDLTLHNCASALGLPFASKRRAQAEEDDGGGKNPFAKKDREEGEDRHDGPPAEANLDTDLDNPGDGGGDAGGVDGAPGGDSQQDPIQSALEELHSAAEDIQDEDVKQRIIAGLADLTAQLFPPAQGEAGDDQGGDPGVDGFGGGADGGDHQEPDGDEGKAVGDRDDDNAGTEDRLGSL